MLQYYYETVIRIIRCNVIRNTVARKVIAKETRFRQCV